MEHVFDRLVQQDQDHPNFEAIDQLPALQKYQVTNQDGLLLQHQ